MPDPRLWDATIEFPVVQLTAGEISCEFEPLTGWIRPLSYGGLEVLRGAYFSVRGEDWSTVLPEVAYEKVAENELTFAQTFRWSGQELVVRGRVRLTADGETATLETDYQADVKAPFRTNRTGLCVLFPGVKTATAFTSKGYPDRSERSGEFQPEVKQIIPATDVAELKWQVFPKVQARLNVEAEHHEVGPELFEFEDQRNWTDDSFKLFIRPSRLPRPYPVPAGRIEQQFRLVLSGPAPTRGSDVIDLSHVAQAFGQSPLAALPGIGSLRKETPDRASWEAEPADGDEWIIRHRQMQEDRNDTRFKDVNRLPADHWWRDRFPAEAPWFRNSAGWANHRFAQEPTVVIGTNAQVHAFDVRSMAETGDGIAALLRSRRPGVILAPVSLGKHSSSPGDIDPRAGTPWHAAWVLSLLYHAQSARAIMLAEWKRGDLLDVALQALPRSDSAHLLSRDGQVVLIGFRGEPGKPDTLVFANTGPARQGQVPDYRPALAQILTNEGWAKHPWTASKGDPFTIPARTVLWTQGTVTEGDRLDSDLKPLGGRDSITGG